MSLGATVRSVAVLRFNAHIQNQNHSITTAVDADGMVFALTAALSAQSQHALLSLFRMFDAESYPQ